MYKSFSNPNLSKQDIEDVHQKFIEVYNRNCKVLNRFDGIFESYIKSKLESAINEFLVPLLSSWNTTLPAKLEILCTFGNGASPIRKNDKEAMIYFRMSRFPNDKDIIFNILFHEFVHILTREPIFLKYNVPENLEERVVDLICYECIQKPVQKMFVNSFANAYITPEAIKTLFKVSDNFQFLFFIMPRIVRFFATTKPAIAFRIFVQHKLPQFLGFYQIRPMLGHEQQFSIRQFPKQEIRYSKFIACPNHQIHR